MQWVVCVTGLVLCGGVPAAPDFNADVRPILSQHCFKCHGPDETHREAELRFDDRQAALQGGQSGEPAIKPGRPDQSELIRRIASDDESEQMPPPSAKLPLSNDQIETLRRWIELGAEYKPHWAFQSPRAVRPPAAPPGSSVRNPIDRFILARLGQESLKPAPEADRVTLIRRVSLDLVGLPPSTDEVDAFLADESPDAYERFVDRLLAAPHYGERWGRRWLDLARYADTNGYEKDRPRSMWPYRDWVIRALNADEPFDQFTIDQIAGDLLPDPTLEQQIATGFHRNTMLNEEGGIDPLEFRFHAMTDRVGTTGTVWLGLTVMCAQCHTHKFDPIPHRDYYRLMACLNNADEVKLSVPEPEIEARRRQILRRAKELTAALPERFPPPADGLCADRPEAERRAANLERTFEAWAQAEREQVVDWTIIRPVELTTNLPRLEQQADGSVLASGDQTKRDVYSLRFEGDFSGATALRLEALPDESLPARGPGRAYYEGPEGDFFLSEITVVAVDRDGRREPLTLADGGESYAKLGIGGGESGARLAIDGEFHTGWATSGREGEPHQAVWRFVEPLPATASVQIKMVFERHYAADLGRFRLALTRSPHEVHARPYPADVELTLRKPPLEWSDSEQQRVRAAFLNLTPELAEARNEIDAVIKSAPTVPTTLVFQERPADHPRPTFVHRRGEFLSPTEPVDAGVLTVLPPFPKDAPRNRLGLARWLVSRDNPLAARVLVNRQWSAFFGRGIVRTAGDFGDQGELPTHPELLDWLAVDFMRDWSVKRLQRLIVTSATYRQSSWRTDEAVVNDPENRWLSSAPRVRLDAELIRDEALKSADLLSEKLYGPSVFPAQPASITTEGAYGQLAWTVSPGEDRHRRGVYTFMKRTAPYAMFSTFDGPTGEACLARREVSNSPLQALTMLNDEVLLEAARALGRIAAARERPEAAGDEARIRWLMRRCLAREPSPDELQQIVQFAQSRRERLAAEPERAAILAGVDTAEAVEPATWTAVARAVMNLDEFVTRE